MLRLYCKDQSLFAGLSERINVLAQVLLRQLVDMVVRSFVCDIDDAPSNERCRVRVFTACNGDGDSGVAPYIPRLGSAFRRVHENPVSFQVNPYRRNLG